MKIISVCFYAILAYCTNDEKFSVSRDDCITVTHGENIRHTVSEDIKTKFDNICNNIMLQIRSYKDNDNIPYVEIKNEEMKIIIKFFEDVNNICESLIESNTESILQGNAKMIINMFRKNMLPLMFINTNDNGVFKTSLLNILKNVYSKVFRSIYVFEKNDFSDFISDSDISIFKKKYFSIFNDSAFYDIYKHDESIYLINNNYTNVINHIKSNELFISLFTLIYSNCSYARLRCKDEILFTRNILYFYLFSLLIINLDDDFALFYLILCVLKTTNYFKSTSFHTNLIIPYHIKQKRDILSKQFIKYMLTNKIFTNLSEITSFIKIFYDQERLSKIFVAINVRDIPNIFNFYIKNPKMQTEIFYYLSKKNFLSFENYIQILLDSYGIIKDKKISELVTKFMLNFHRYKTIHYKNDDIIIKECIYLLNSFTISTAKYICDINNFINERNEIDLILLNDIIYIWIEILNKLRYIKVESYSLRSILSHYTFTNKGIFFKQDFNDNNNIKRIIPIITNLKIEDNENEKNLIFIDFYKFYLLLFSINIIESYNIINTDKVSKHHCIIIALKLYLRTKLQQRNLFIPKEINIFDDEDLEKIRDEKYFNIFLYIGSRLDECIDDYKFRESEHFLSLSEYYSNYFFNMRNFILDNIKTDMDYFHHKVTINLDKNKNIFMESVRKFDSVNIKINSYINIKDGTPATGDGVLSSWMTKISEHIKNSMNVLFRSSRDTEDIYIPYFFDEIAFNQKSIEYEFIGKVIGICFSNTNCILDVEFAGYVYDILLAKEVNLDEFIMYEFFYYFDNFNNLSLDIETVEDQFTVPLCYYNNVTKKYKIDDSEVILDKDELTSIVENGVISIQIKEKIKNLISRHLVEPIKKMREGLLQIVDLDILSLFTDSKEFKKIISGDKTIDVKKWRKLTHVSYIYQETDCDDIVDLLKKTEELFWELIDESDNSARKKLMRYWAAVSNLPFDKSIKSFYELKICYKGKKIEAHTCTRQLDIPATKDKEMLSTFIKIITETNENLTFNIN
ncbi:putative E3 ubiquitin-protein ligase TOM1 [Astathelohania contejeani]|uniref:HECT-type E3 ubiquitin transferase n=1 Tax=Astathelohania contejeani TaxID=164912 RepID=A0ABQ7HVL8_9MICR|nr:putative E3 ubiquitin-protein ligase TOM1 [Thelohania contejeani]